MKLAILSSRLKFRRFWFGMNKTLLIFFTVFCLLSATFLVCPLTPAEASKSIYVFPPIGAEEQYWWNEAWQHRKKVTIDSTLIDEQIRDFPVLVKLTSSNFYFNHANSSGQDIRFLDSNNKPLNYKIERWNSADEQAEIWVKIPSISNTSDTCFWMYYGNNATSNDQNAPAVWDSNYVMVQHLNENCSGDGGTHYDPTLNGNDGTTRNGVDTTTIGIIDGADAFDGVDDYIEVVSPSGLNAHKVTISAWFKGFKGITGNGRWLVSAETTNVTVWDDVGEDPNKFSKDFDSSDWNFLTTILDYDKGETSVYLNGELVGTKYMTGDGLSRFIENQYIGAYMGRSHLFSGSLDEVRISNKSRSNAWIKASYLSGKNHLLSFGSEEPDIMPPEVTILSPKNVSYATSTIPLNFTVNELVSWMGYSLNGETNVTITGNITLPGLFNGTYSIIVYANDTSGSMGFSDLLYFTVDTIAPRIEAPSRTPDGDVEPNQQVIVSVDVTDQVSGLDRVVLSYTTDNRHWSNVTMRSLLLIDSGCVLASGNYSNFDVDFDFKAVNVGEKSWNTPCVYFCHNNSFYYRLVFHKNNLLELAKMTQEGYVPNEALKDINLNVLRWNHVKIRKIGDVVDVYLNNQSVLTYRDTTLQTQGKIGFGADTSTAQFTNITIKNAGIRRYLYNGVIPGQPPGSFIKYKIVAYDNAGNFEVNDNAGQCFLCTVKSVFPVALTLLVLLIAIMLVMMMVVVLKKKRKKKFTEILIVIVLFLFSLRVFNWLEYPYFIASGDLRPPLVQEAFIKHALYEWNEIDFGVPSVYMPRFLGPFNFFSTCLNTLGLDLCWSHVITMLLMYFFSSLLMYGYVKELTDGKIIVAFVAALYLTSNIFLVNDREQTAVGFIDLSLMVLPCLFTFTRGLRKQSNRLMAISGLLFVLTYATFPNYRPSLICLIMLAITLMFIFVSRGTSFVLWKKKSSKKLFNISINTTLASTYLQLFTVFLFSAVLASIWIVVFVTRNLDLVTGVHEQMAVPRFVLNLKFFDVARLIAKWSFYEEGLGRPYVFYGTVYLNDRLMIFLSYLPTVLAFASLLTSRFRKLTTYFSGVALVSLLLTSGFGHHFKEVYIAVVSAVPFLMAFRESTHWIFFVVFSYGILIGVSVSVLYHKLRIKRLQVAVLGLVAFLFISTSFPLVTGDVTRNWIDRELKGSYFPHSYEELNSVLSNDYWGILLPKRGTYIVYNFTEGLRTYGVLGCGNPYPFVFSKPIISGLGTEYITSQNQNLLNQIYDLNYSSNSRGVSKLLGILGIKYIILENDLVLGNLSTVTDLSLRRNEDFMLVREWSEVKLFENTHAVQKLYVGNNILNYSTLKDMYTFSLNSSWSVLEHSLFVDNVTAKRLIGKNLSMPENFVWKEVSPMQYEAYATSEGPFFLVLLESYDENWRVSVNGEPVHETNHFQVNGVANGWLIDAKGELTLTVVYETQSYLMPLVLASIILPTIIAIGKTSLMEMIRFICCKLRFVLARVGAKLKRKIENVSF